MWPIFWSILCLKRRPIRTRSCNNFIGCASKILCHQEHFSSQYYYYFSGRIAIKCNVLHVGDVILTNVCPSVCPSVTTPAIVTRFCMVVRCQNCEDEFVGYKNLPTTSGFMHTENLQYMKLYFASEAAKIMAKICHSRNIPTKSRS